MSLLDAFRRRASTLPDTRHAEFEASDGAKARVNPGEDELEALITRHQRDAVLLDPPPAPVAADYAARAKAIAGYVARELGGEAPRVKFFGRLHDHPLVNGICHESSVIWLAADLPREKAALVVVHEVLHALRPEWDHGKIWPEARRLVAELEQPAQPMAHPVDAAPLPAPGNKSRIVEWG